MKKLLDLLTISQIDDTALRGLVTICEDEGLSHASTVKYVQAAAELRRFTLHGEKRRVRRTPPRQRVVAWKPKRLKQLLALNNERSDFYLLVS